MARSESDSPERYKELILRPWKFTLSVGISLQSIHTRESKRIQRRDRCKVGWQTRCNSEYECYSYHVTLLVQ
jgi:hypothetical protein